MTTTSEWDIPTATVTQAVDLRPEAAAEPLTWVEKCRLREYTADPHVEWTDTRHEWNWLLFMRWLYRRDRFHDAG